MASYSDTERPRHGRERRPRYVYDSDSDQGPPLPRREPRRERPPPQSFQQEQPPAKPPRRRSILVDPDETASQKDNRRRARSNSRVRLQTSSDDESDYRRAGRSTREPRGSRRDLERKNSHDNLRFREKRDGYESDEGETLKRSRSAREPNRSRRGEYEGGPPNYPDYDRKPYSGETLRPPRAGADDASLPLRGKRRDPIDAPVAYGAAPVTAAVMPEPPPFAHSRTADYARDTIPTRRDRERDYDPYAGPPPPPPGERDEPRRRPRRNTDYEEDRGYRSDGPPRRPRERPDRDGYGDYDPYDRRRGGEEEYRPRGDRRPAGPRNDDYLSDYREDRPPRRDRDRRDGRERYRESEYEPRDKYRDFERRRSFHDDRDRERARDRDRDRDRDRNGKSRGKKTPDWQKEAGALFMGYAMPVIKKEGTKIFRDQMQKFLARRGGQE